MNRRLWIIAAIIILIAARAMHRDRYFQNFNGSPSDQTFLRMNDR